VRPTAHLNASPLTTLVLSLEPVGEVPVVGMIGTGEGIERSVEDRHAPTVVRWRLLFAGDVARTGDGRAGGGDVGYSEPIRALVHVVGIIEYGLAGLQDFVGLDLCGVEDWIGAPALAAHGLA
jgi:hypothetical protein